MLVVIVYVILQLLGLFIIARGLGECSEDWAGAWRWGCGGGGGGGGGGEGWEVEFLTETHAIFFSEGGGGFWGVWGAPRPHPGVARGRKTIHFFL